MFIIVYATLDEFFVIAKLFDIVNYLQQRITKRANILNQ